ncbi:MAG: hypothetical protein U9O20_00550 [Patescibacteria group bacterium]|nr:hypothetical protein [Patescibacteria group bacterium]
MGIKDLFKKKKERSAEEKYEETLKGGGAEKVSEALSNVDKSKLSFKEKMGMKMFQKMSREKQEEVLRKAMNPAEVQKNKDKILAQVDEMVRSGQIDKGQAEAVKSRMGLR